MSDTHIRESDTLCLCSGSRKQEAGNRKKKAKKRVKVNGKTDIVQRFNCMAKGYGISKGNLLVG
jgi:hypothetical protein